MSASPTEMESSPFQDLLHDHNVWTQWAPRDEARPRFDIDVDGGPGGRTALSISCDGKAHAMGSWRFSLHDVKPGQSYRIEVLFSCEDIPAPGKSVRALLTFPNNAGGPQSFGQLDYVGKRDGWTVLATEFEADADRKLSLDLLSGWSASGRVRWADPRLVEITESPAKRTVTLAAVNGNPKEPQSPADCVRFYCERIEAAAAQGADMVVLPEFANVVGLPDRINFAEPIPGPTSDYLSERAREKGVHVAAGILERQADALFNTGLLIDRKGGLVGKYRKTHLPNEELLAGLTPGETYPVFAFEFGTVGYMVCYDAHYPEVPRALSLNGAEVIVFSNMGDGREKGTVWEPFIRSRAVDSQVHIAASVNSGRSCIVSPKGEILAMAKDGAGELAIAECDLTDTVSDHTGRPIRRRYDQIRRADSYSTLTQHPYGS